MVKQACTEGSMPNREMVYLGFSNDDSVQWNRFHRIRVNYAIISCSVPCLLVRDLE